MILRLLEISLRHRLNEINMNIYLYLYLQNPLSLLYKSTNTDKTFFSTGMQDRQTSSNHNQNAGRLPNSRTEKCENSGRCRSDTDLQQMKTIKNNRLMPQEPRYRMRQFRHYRVDQRQCDYWDSSNRQSRAQERHLS